MIRRFRILALLLCILSTFSLCALPALADETVAEADITTAPAEETTVAQPEVTLPPADETTSGTETTAPPADDTTEPSTEAYAVELIVTMGVGAKTEYNAGEFFNPENYFGSLKMSDGSTLPLSELKYLQTDALTAENTFITFVYESLTCHLPVKVISAPYAVGVEFTSTKTDFMAMEIIDPSTFAASLVYSDGSKAPLDLSLCTVFPALDTPASATTEAYTLSYSDGTNTFTASLAVNVAPIVSIEVTGIERAKLYESTDRFIPLGITVTAYYDEAKTVSQVLTNYSVTSDTVLVTPDDTGKTKLTVTADNVSTEIEVTVLPIVDYEITGCKNKYYYGDAFNVSDITVIAFYSDYTRYEVTDQVVFTAPEIIVAGSTITAFHNGFDLQAFLNIMLPVGTLDIITPPTKLHYEIGEVFNPAGLVIGIDYSDGYRKILRAEDCELVVSNPLTAADKVVAIRYYGASTNVSISVGDELYIVSLNIVGAPDKWTYFEGELLNTSGMVIEAYMSDGSKITVDPAILNFFPSLDTPLAPDVTTVKISANDGTDKYCEASFPITVIKKTPTALVATTKPNQLEYNEGQTFNPEGLTLSLIFNDGSSMTPASFSFSIDITEPFMLYKNATEKRIVEVIYEYDGQAYTYPIEITIHPAQIDSLVISRQPIKTEYKPGEEFIPMGVEILIIYKDRTLSPQIIPEGYFTYSPQVITETTKEVIFSFRDTVIALPITVTGVTTSENTTAPIDPPTTTAPSDSSESTTEGGEVTNDTTTESTTDVEVTEDPTETPGSSEITSSPDSDTTPGDESTGDNSSSGNKSSLLYLWIIIIAIIIAALVALIIYYKKNFT
jgi:hypothetical protein